jgi:hypothetical protein
MKGGSVIGAFLSLTAALAGASEVDGDTPPRSTCDPSLSNSTIFDYSINNVYGNESIDLSSLRGKVTLIVNVATY